MVSSSIVNGLEKKLRGKANVVRVDLLTKLGQQIAELYSVTSAGTNIVLDAAGKETHRSVGVPDSEVIVKAIYDPVQ